MRGATLKDRPNFPLMRQADVQHVYHMQMPRWLFADPRYKDLPLEAKVVYMFLLNRFQLSRRNGWTNDCGEVFIIFPRKELARELRICEQRVTAAFRQLSARELIWEKRCGRGDANQIYLANVDPQDDPGYTSAPFLQPEKRDSRAADFEGLERSDALQEPQGSGFQNSKTCTSRTAHSASQEPQNAFSSKKESSHTYRSCSEVSPPCAPEGMDDASEEELAEILDGCELETFEPETARVFESAIERLYFSTQLRIGGAVLPGRRVRARLRFLDAMVLRDAECRLHTQLGKPVKRSLEYIMTVIFNSISESEGDLLVDPYLNSLRSLGKGG